MVAFLSSMWFGDFAVVGCISDGWEKEYRALVDVFLVVWKKSSASEHGQEFRSKMTATRPLCILGEDVGAVEDYKYLVVHTDNRMNWKIYSLLHCLL